MYKVKFHSFYMRYEVYCGRKLLARFISEDAAHNYVYKLKYNNEEGE